MTAIWISIAAISILSFAIKAAGPSLLGDRPVPPRARGVIALLAPALLAAIVTSDVLGQHWAMADGPLALGVLAALAGRLLRAPAPACVIAAVAVTAGTRALL